MDEKNANNASGVAPTRERPRIPNCKVDKNGFCGDEPAPTPDELQALFGTKTPEAANSLYYAGIMALGPGANELNQLLPALAVEEEPRSAVEAMQLLNLATTQVLISRLSMAMNMETVPQERWAKQLVSALGVFTRQVETLRRYRTGGAQTVRIEHVNVNDGGKAIIGQVSRGEGARDTNEG